MSEAAAGPGAIVRAQREARGLTRQDVADSLNLGQRVIEDIETGNWARLPTPAFTRGYLRAYAKLLDIDPDEVTKAFEAAVDRGEMRKTADDSKRRRRQGRGLAELMQKHPGAVLSGAVGAVICAVLIVLWTVWPAQKESVATAVVAADPIVPRPLPAASAAEVSNEPAQPSNMAVHATVLATAAVVSPASASAPSPSYGSDTPGVRRITNNGNDRLKFSFTQECWVEIKDAQGASLYSDLSQSGDTLELVGRPPFHILLGNAPAVTMAFNGERVALSPHTRNNVGTLVLGQ